MDFKNFFWIAILLTFIFSSLSDCKWVKRKLKITTTVTETKQGTPDRIIQDVLKAAAEKDDELAWNTFFNLLHSEERETIASVKNWKEFKFPAIRRKVDYLIMERSSVSFKIAEERQDTDNYMQIFVENSKSDMPTPCILKKDPAQNNEWKVSYSCF
jgi:hypothetical protein